MGNEALAAIEQEFRVAMKDVKSREKTGTQALEHTRLGVHRNFNEGYDRLGDIRGDVSGLVAKAGGDKSLVASGIAPFLAANKTLKADRLADVPLLGLGNTQLASSQRTAIGMARAQAIAEEMARQEQLRQEMAIAQLNARTDLEAARIASQSDPNQFAQQKELQALDHQQALERAKYGHELDLDSLERETNAQLAAERDKTAGFTTAELRAKWQSFGPREISGEKGWVFKKLDPQRYAELNSTAAMREIRAKMEWELEHKGDLATAARLTAQKYGVDHPLLVSMLFGEYGL